MENLTQTLCNPVGENKQRLIESQTERAFRCFKWRLGEGRANVTPPDAYLSESNQTERTREQTAREESRQLRDHRGEVRQGHIFLASHLRCANSTARPRSVETGRAAPEDFVETAKLLLLK